MSFILFGNEPTYNHFSDTYRWNFYNVFDLQQYQMCNGQVRYVLMENLRNAEVIFTSEKCDIAEYEFKELETLIMKKLWFHFNNFSVKVSDTFEIINKLCNEKYDEH